LIGGLDKAESSGVLAGRKDEESGDDGAGCGTRNSLYCRPSRLAGFL